MAWIDTLLAMMVDCRASDLHMTSGRTPMFRVDGDITEVQGCTEITREQMESILFEVAPKRNQEEFTRTHDTDFAYAIEGIGRFRVNYFQDQRGMGGAFRLIPQDVLTAEQLSLPKSVVDFCYLSKGLVVVTGPTGSGKSTTLAAMVDHVNKTRSDHIVTIEDPVEFVHKDQRCLVHQREVGRDTDSFKRALRAALREDPDIILVGEMRDLETIEIALETAETGHLVFGTLHTTTAASTVDRIIDQFPADRQAQIRTMLSISLKGVVAQTLCKKKGGGRVAAMEVLVANSAVASLIREAKSHQIISAMQTGAKFGMRLMNDSLCDLVQRGLVEASQAYLKAVDKDDLVNRFQNAGIQFDTASLKDKESSTTPTQGGSPNPQAPLPGGGAQQQRYAPRR